MGRLPAAHSLDYLVIGHLTTDLAGRKHRLGGTAAYASLTARVMGYKVGLVTSYPENRTLPQLEGIRLINQPGPAETTFKNTYTASGRIQHLIKRAPDLDPRQIPEDLRTARLVHLAPVAREIPLDAGRFFPGAHLGYSLQGWLRQWDANGRVLPRQFPTNHRIPPAGTAFLSEEDLGSNHSDLDQIRKMYPEVVFTRGSRGAVIFREEEITEIPGIPTREHDPTGAGDIFAAVYLILRVLEGRSVSKAAERANQIAAKSLERTGISGVPRTADLQQISKG